MYLVSDEEVPSQNYHWEVISSISNAMLETSTTLEIQPWVPSENEFEIVSYVTILQIRSIQQKIKLFWQFKLLNHILIIKISLLDEQPLSQQIQYLIRKNHEKVVFYFNHINNLQIFQNQGQFYVHSQSKIVYQYREDNWFALKNPLKLKNHLIKKLKRISQMYRKNIEDFLIKFKLVPSKQLQKQTQQIVQKLNLLKYLFQNNKKNPAYPSQQYQPMLKYRQNSSQIDLKKVDKFDRQIISFIQGRLTKKQFSFRTVQQSPEYEQLKYKFKDRCNSYSNFSEYNQMIYPLVIAMEILQVKNQQILCSKGGFGQISKGLYSCKYGKTIFQDINKELQGEIYFSQQVFKRYLCKKCSLVKECPSFQNQKQALMKMRNKKNPHIAQYYCNITKGKPFQDGNIYMDVYYSNIKDIPIKLKHKFKILMEVIKGLYFLNSNGIIHRDLKPQNIVVDRQMNSKIIDFGSCSNVYQKSDFFKPHDNKLRSTPGYYVHYQTYMQCLQNKEKKLNKQNFYEHYFFDIYSYGKVMGKIFELSEYEFISEDILMSQIYYLYSKCCETNPADRISHEEIQFFLQSLHKLEKSISV